MEVTAMEDDIKAHEWALLQKINRFERRASASGSASGSMQGDGPYVIPMPSSSTHNHPNPTEMIRIKYDGGDSDEELTMETIKPGQKRMMAAAIKLQKRLDKSADKSKKKEEEKNDE